jgi:phosphoribosylaminoimidazole carboxylase PurE protein
MNSIQIAILMGSDSDFPTLEKGVALLKKEGIPFRIEVSSAHRTPERTLELIREFEKQGAQVIICAAGGAAHLPGVVAAHTLLPVLGIPIDSNISGIDSLYSIVQMPAGIPVAAFGIGKAGAMNAILFALHLIALQDERIAEIISRFRQEQSRQVLKKNTALQELINSL